jgi:hypothetical protein
MTKPKTTTRDGDGDYNDDNISRHPHHCREPLLMGWIWGGEGAREEKRG